MTNNQKNYVKIFNFLKKKFNNLNFNISIYLISTLSLLLIYKVMEIS
jgi:hypothetical protein